MTEPRIRVVVKQNVIRVLKPAHKIVRVQAPGPQGIPGEASSSFNFVQSTPATEWTINHNLGFRPNVAAYSVGGLEMLGEILHLSNNVVKINFNIAVAGTARLV